MLLKLSASSYGMIKGKDLIILYLAQWGTGVLTGSQM